MSKAIPENAEWYLDEYDAERFWQHVDRNGGTPYKTDPLATASGQCWNWNGKSGGDYYGRFVIFGTWKNAHRIAFLDMGHKIPDDMVLDHLCRNKSCVNPAHLEAVTQSVNVRRGSLVSSDYCKYGHKYTEAVGTGKMRCKTCLQESRRRSYARSKERSKAA